MKKLVFVICVLVATSALQGAQLTRGPYLEDPTQSTLILRWQTDVPSPGWLEYGPAPRCNQIMTVSPEAYNHKIVLYGLVPNQDFCYRLYVYNRNRDGVQEPVEGTFRTLFSPERKIVNFLVMGDTGSQSAVDENGTPLPDEAAQARAQLAALMQQEKSDFIIHTGNLTSSGLNEDANASFFTPFQTLLQHNPLFVALGPNEYGPSRESRDSKSFLLNNYTRYHNMSWSNATPKYYSFDTANARFVFLDANVAQGAVWGPEIGPDSAQTTWLKTTLSGAGEKWKIVVVNTPLYSSGANGPNNEVFANWAKIFEDYGVKLVLQGGDKNYERTFGMFRGETKPRGVTYMTIGTSAAHPTKREHPDPSTARFVSARHYAAVQIVDRKLSVRVYSDRGKQLDTFDLYL